MNGGIAEDFVKHSVANFSVVIIKDLPNAIIVPSDSVGISVKKSATERIRYMVQRDTLTVSGIRADTLEAALILYLPTTSIIDVYNSSVFIRGALRRTDPHISYRFNLHNSTISTTELPKELRTFQHYGDLFVKGTDSAHVNIRSRAIVNHLKMIDVTNVLVEKEARIHKMETEYLEKARIFAINADGRTEINAQ